MKSPWYLRTSNGWCYLVQDDLPHHCYLVPRISELRIIITEIIQTGELLCEGTRIGSYEEASIAYEVFLT